MRTRGLGEIGCGCASRELYNCTMTVESETVISCSNCVGACCRMPTVIQLTHPEVEFLEVAGTDLNPIIDARETETLVAYNGDDHLLKGKKLMAMCLPVDVGIYEIASKCGYLDTEGKCTVYDNPNRPRACGLFEVGSEVCVELRKGHGLPT